MRPGGQDGGAQVGQGRGDVFGDRPLAVAGDTDGREPHGTQQVDELCVGGVLDEHVVARMQADGQQTVDAVHRAADDHLGARIDPRSREVGGRSLQQRRERHALPVQVRALHAGLKRPVKRRQQGWVGVAVADVADAVGHGERRSAGDRWAQADAHAPVAFADQQSALSQLTVGGVDGRGADGELTGERAHRGQGRPRFEQAATDRGLDVHGDLSCGGAARDVL